MTNSQLAVPAVLHGIIVERIKLAADRVVSAKLGTGDETVADAKDNLRTVVQAASDDGMSWQSIGDALDMRRGAAYQRFRTLPRVGSRLLNGTAH